VNRRGYIRFQMGVPVLAQWQDDEGNAHEAAGFSRDISARGVFVVSSAPPPEATKVTIEVLIPNLREGSEEVHLRSEGLVVRVEEKGRAAGCAIYCDFTSW